jgi:hypothetical protein
VNSLPNGERLTLTGDEGSPASGPGSGFLTRGYRVERTVPVGSTKIHALLTARPPRQVRFVLTRFENLDEGRCAAYVELQGPGASYTGRAEGGSRDVGGLRAAAEATAGALRDLGHAVTLQDVQSIRAVGEFAVAVRVKAEHGHETRELVGFCLAGDDPMRAAALAVLNATNRFLDLG